MNKIKEQLRNGNLVIGTWLQTGSCVVAEIIAEYGFDFIAADIEHTSMSENDFIRFSRTINSRSASYARVKGNDLLSIRRILDCGCEGIIIPLVETKEQALTAVESAKYPPEGKRGFAFCRANQWGKNFDEYSKNANSDIVIIVMIETKKGIENIDEILSVDGIDGVFIGPYDMSGSYGVVGETSHPLVIQAKATVLEACKKHKKAAGQHIVLPNKENVQEAIIQGYTFLALGMDTVFIANELKKTKEFLNIDMEKN